MEPNVAVSWIRRRCRNSILFKLALAIIIVFFGLLHLSQGNVLNSRGMLGFSRKEVPYEKFFKGLEKYAIKGPSLKKRYKTEKAKEIGYDDDKFLFSKAYLENVLDIPEKTLLSLKKSHHAMVHEFIPNLLEKEGIDTFGIVSRSSPEWEEYVSSKGYVIIGGGQYSWLAYLVVKQMRATGAAHPIEVFIPSQKEYEVQFCETILPKYNARCNLLDEPLRLKVQKKFDVRGYQLKMLAVLTSKFGNVMYLDSDLFPTRNVDYLFESYVYKQHGLILWPDYWHRTTNPKFYDIAELPVEEEKVRYSPYDLRESNEHGGKPKPLSEYTFADSHFHDFKNTLPNPSSEAGVMIINKTSHLKTMLLAMYYNIYGPNYYYPLFTQGSAGEGDKETFIAAATVLGQPYFQTEKPFKWVGYYHEDTGEFQSKGLAHYDPVTGTEHSETAPIVFLHCSYPKYYTGWLYENHDLIYEDGKTHIRMYNDLHREMGYDLELRLQTLFVQGVCEEYFDAETANKDGWAGGFLKYIASDKKINKKRCKEVFMPHLEWLKQTTPQF